MKIIQEYIEANLNDIIEVIAANYIGEYAISVSFTDGTIKFVDFKPFLIKSLHPSISKYLDKRLFKSFVIKDGNLNWNDYDLIFPIHDLYQGIVQ